MAYLSPIATLTLHNEPLQHSMASNKRRLFFSLTGLCSGWGSSASGCSTAEVSSRFGLDSDSFHVTPYSPWNSSCQRHVLLWKLKEAPENIKNTLRLEALAFPFPSHWSKQAPWPSPTPGKQEIRSIILCSVR